MSVQLCVRVQSLLYRLVVVAIRVGRCRKGMNKRGATEKKTVRKRAENGEKTFDRFVGAEISGGSVGGKFGNRGNEEKRKPLVFSIFHRNDGSRVSAARVCRGTRRVKFFSAIRVRILCRKCFRSYKRNFSIVLPRALFKGTVVYGSSQIM